MVTVSIVIPVYNKEKYISKCIESLLSQTFNDFEIILIDDGSKDSSMKILQEYADCDSRIRLFHQENMGAGKTRNEGILYAIGKYIIFLDADDFFEKVMLEEMVIKAEKENADVTLCGAYKYDNQLQEDIKINHWLKTENFLDNVIYPEKCKNILSITGSCIWNKMYNRKFILDNKLQFQSLPCNNDTAFAIISMCLANKICYVDEVMVHYRYNNEHNISSERGNHMECSIEAHKYVRKELKRRGKFIFFRDSLEKEVELSAYYELGFCKDSSIGKTYISKMQHLLRGNRKIKLGYYYKGFRDIRTFFLFGLIPILKIVHYKDSKDYYLFGYLKVL